MIGHGSRDFSSGLFALGDRSGTITINAGREVSIENGSFGFTDEAWIGHVTASGTISGADITVTAMSFDQDASLSAGPGAVGILDIAMLAENTGYGDVTFVATDATAGASLVLTGTTANGNCECNEITTTGDLVIQAAGDLELDSAFLFANVGGGDLALAAGANFHNNSGADAIGAMQGRWLIYSTRPDLDTGDIGVLGAEFIDYQTVFDPSNPFGAAGTANGLIYAVAPVITIADATTTYGGTLVLPGVSLVVDGAVVTAADFGLSLGSAFVNNLAVTFSASGFINAGNYTDALLASFSIVPTSVTAINDLSFDPGLLTVDRAVLTGSVIGTPTKAYDGTDVATLTAANFLLNGFVSGEGGTVNATTGTYATANASDPNLVTVALAAGDFAGAGSTDLANYVLPTLVSGNGAITRLALSGTIIGAPTKVYDGTNIATLTVANFLLTGFVAGQGATVSQTSGTYATANVADPNLVTVALAAGDFAAAGATNLANYILPTLVSGDGAITPLALAGSIIGTPTKVYDGTNAATLTAANFLLTGFVTGEGATISATSGTYATANAADPNLVTAGLAAGDFTANSGTLLSNYILPTTVTGNGAITRAALAAGSIVGAPIKVYDGTNIATLTSANFLHYRALSRVRGRR